MPETRPSEATPGVDLARLSSYLATTRPGMVDGPLRARLVTGGKSNLTYEITDGESTWILRRPPLGHVLATAHDMAREYRVMRALALTMVPVPTTYTLCDDTAVIGAPFYVMEKVGGTSYRRAGELSALGPERTRLISMRMIDTLATLHDVEPAAVGLTDFGRPSGFLARQVRRWGRQLDASGNRDLPGADELHAALSTNVPAGSPPSVVHGDFRLDNLLIDEKDGVAAVLDWEMATLGDPLTDVALLPVYETVAALDLGDAFTDVPRAPGFLPSEQLLGRYAERSGRDLADLGFYLGLAYFKLATILEGIHYRHLHGQTVGDGFDGVGAAVVPLIDAGLTAMKEYR